MIDIVQEIEAIQREVGRGRVPAGEGPAITLRRTYQAPIEDVWDALTNPGRIGRWFLPVTGDFRLGGTYQFEGNAGGTILECDRPNRFKVTWVFGDADPSEVVIRLTPAGHDATTFEMVHTAVVPEEMWSEYGPGAVGVGWDGGLLGLSLHLRGLKLESDPMLWHTTDDGREFYRGSSAAWGAADLASGADAATAERRVANTLAFYAPPPEG